LNEEVDQIKLMKGKDAIDDDDDEEEEEAIGCVVVVESSLTRSLTKTNTSMTDEYNEDED